MKIIETTFQEGPSLLQKYISEEQEVCIYCVQKENFVAIGSYQDANIAKAHLLNTTVASINHAGGTIVVSPGDVDIVILSLGYSGDAYRNKFIEILVDRLHKIDSDVKLLSNDILFKGKKVGSYGSKFIGNTLFTTIHVSIGINLDLIRSVCLKPMTKEPDGLGKYGITAEDVVDILNIVFKNT